MSDKASGAESASVITIEEAQESYRRGLEEWSSRLKLSIPDLEVFVRNGFDFERVPVLDSPNRRAMLAYLKKAEIPPPKWLMITGLYPETPYEEGERRKRLRALYRAMRLYIRRALLRQEAGGDEDERSVFWDPIAEVCRGLEIAPSKLSALCKEFSGHSLSQAVDCVRAERVKKLMRGKIRGFVAGWKTQCASLAEEKVAGWKPAPQETAGLRPEGEKDGEVWAVWKALKASRQWPAFCQTTWAIEFGFSTYRRMYRACLAVWKQTPHQLEMALIEECLKGESGAEIEVGEMTMGEVEGLIRGIFSYMEEGGGAESDISRKDAKPQRAQRMVG